MRGNQSQEIVLASEQGDGSSAWVRYPGGQATIFVSGTFDGATAQVQASIDQATALSTETTGSFTSGAARDFRSAPCFLRITVAGGSGAEAIDVVLKTYSDA